MFKKRKKLKIALLSVLVLLLVGGVFANSYVKKYGYKNLGDFISTYWENKSLAAEAKFETLEINIDPLDFEKLEKVRKKALERGILIDEGGAYVNAKLSHNGKKIKAKLRLKGHMTDHLQDKKWSFRIKTKKGDAFMGMKIFSIQHPGTRNYAYEWLYHQMMKQEDIIALNYDFINVKVNDENWGIYAVEEHFAQELIQRNKRPAGPILRFNPDMYWSYRIAEHEKQPINMESALMQSANIETYDDNNVYADSVLLNAYEKGMILLEKFRRGESSTSQVFDIEKLAKFHAVIDLVGGHHSLDWSDVKYYYNSVTRKIEPVAYESFSVQPASQICGSYRFVDLKKNDVNNFHATLFSDPLFFKEYIFQLKRIASKKWLDAFLKKNKKNLDSKLATVFTEFAYKKFETTPYYRNIKLIDQNLHPKKGVHAYVNGIKSDTLLLSVATTDALPFNLVSISVGGKKQAIKNVILPAKQKGSTLTYIPIRVALPSMKEKINSSQEIMLQYELLGSGVKMETTVAPAKANEFATPFNAELVLKPSDLTKYSFLEIDKSAKIIRFTGKKISLSSTLVIEKGYKVFFNPGTTIDFIQNATMFSYSPFYADGTIERHVDLISSDGTGVGIILLNTSAESVFSYTTFRGFAGKPGSANQGALVAYESDLKINNCSFIQNTSNHICSFRNNVKINNSNFESGNSNALNINYATINVSNSNFLNTSNHGVEAFGSVVKIQNCLFDNIKGSAVYARSKTDLNIVHSKINKAKCGLEAKDGSIVNSANCQIENCTFAIKASKKGDVFGPSSVLVKELKQEKNKVLKEAEKGSTIDIK
ncbi:MAG TPA: CotH kinase family protein [Flavobacteriales bacterium]|nr:CotH kinase family protein [Flavobacteriales bacterium]